MLRPLGKSISLNWYSSSKSTLAETQDRRWAIVGASNVRGYNNHIRATRGRVIETKSPSSGALIRRSPQLGVARMAPELSTTEVVDGAITTAENGGRENKLGAVFFDMDDTLVLTHAADSQAHLAVMAFVAVRAPQVDQSAVLKAFLERFDHEPWDPEHKVEVTEWRARLWGTALAKQGVKDIDLARDCQNCFDKERLAGFRWTTGVERIVKTLHRQGIKVGIITNGHAQVQRAKLKACNAEELFDTILVGGEERNPKPHRDIFLKACNLAGCKPEESIIVGDTLKTDIQGGVNAGFLSTVWVNVHKREPRPCSSKPDHVIATFIDLQHVLEQYGVLFEPSA